MLRYEFAIDGKRIHRVNKAVARKAFDSGKDVFMIPCNLSPVSPWSLGGWFYKMGDEDDRAFDVICNSFEFYNCKDTETGMYAAFYLES